jgi:hypothetical protein
MEAIADAQLFALGREFLDQPERDFSSHTQDCVRRGRRGNGCDRRGRYGWRRRDNLTLLLFRLLAAERHPMRLGRRRCGDQNRRELHDLLPLCDSLPEHERGERLPQVVNFANIEWRLTGTSALTPASFIRPAIGR